MMRKILILAVLLVSTISMAQRIQKGESQLNAGVGFTSGWGLPIYAGFDYALEADITIGGQLSFASEDHNYGSADDVKGNWFGLGVNGNYHFNNLLNLENVWDAYAGLTLAYNSFSWDYPSSYPEQYKGGASSGIGLAAQIGARYFFNDNFAINLEFGGGNVASGGKLGITYTL